MLPFAHVPCLYTRSTANVCDVVVSTSRSGTIWSNDNGRVLRNMHTYILWRMHSVPNSSCRLKENIGRLNRKSWGELSTSITMSTYACTGIEKKGLTLLVFRRKTSCRYTQLPLCRIISANDMVLSNLSSSSYNFLIFLINQCTINLSFLNVLRDDVVIVTIYSCPH